MDNADERLEKLELDLAEIKVLLEKVHEYMVKTDTFITTVGTQIEPMIEDVKSGGMMKLITGFGKKKS